MRLVVLLVFVVGCANVPFTSDNKVKDCGGTVCATVDGGPTNHDAGANTDGSPSQDATASIDASPLTDAPSADAAPTDAAPTDAAPTDAAPTDAASSSFSMLCDNGPGYKLWQISFQSGFVRLDHWDANCNYSVGDQLCVGSAFGVTDIDNGVAVSLNGNDFVRVRFNVNGLSFTSASLHVNARGIGGSSRMKAESQVAGFTPEMLVPVDFSYKWFSFDWSAHLQPNNSPSLTAVDIERASGTLGIKTVELCVN